MTSLLQLIMSAAGIATVLLIVRLGYRWGFDPIDATILAVAGYIGFLIVGGLLINLTPLGLSLWGILANALVGLVLVAALSWIEVKRGLSPGFEPERAWFSFLRRRPNVRKLSAAICAGAVLTGAVLFAHRAEVDELEPRSLATYVDRRDTGTTWFVVDNGTDLYRAVNVVFSNGTVHFTLRPQQSWSWQLVPGKGQFTVLVTSGKESESVRLDDLGTRGEPVIGPSIARPPDV